jgi:hypothetical protein
MQLNRCLSYTTRKFQKKNNIMNIFNQFRQYLDSLIDGKPSDIEKNISDTKSNQDLLEEIQERIRELQRRGI